MFGFRVRVFFSCPWVLLVLSGRIFIRYMSLTLFFSLSFPFVDPFHCIIFLYPQKKAIHTFFITYHQQKKFHRLPVWIIFNPHLPGSLTLFIMIAIYLCTIGLWRYSFKASNYPQSKFSPHLNLHKHTLPASHLFFYLHTPPFPPCQRITLTLLHSSLISPHTFLSHLHTPPHRYVMHLIHLCLHFHTFITIYILLHS